MRAMILAAGRGDRMRPLTDTTPKPLLKVRGKCLIEYSLDAVKRAGIKEVVINVAYLKDQMKQALGNGERYGLSIAYSEEAERLETGGGIVKALPLLGDAPFLVLSSDIISDFPLDTLFNKLNGLAHLVLVKNPDFHPTGDFSLQNNVISREANNPYTFANIGVYHPDLFLGCEPSHFPLSQILFPAVDKKEVTGEVYAGKWENIGRPAQLDLA